MSESLKQVQPADKVIVSITKFLFEPENLSFFDKDWMKLKNRNIEKKAFIP